MISWLSNTIATLQETEAIFCKYKSTCQLRGKCPWCKSADLLCNSKCSCGSRQNPCKNKVNQMAWTTHVSINVFYLQPHIEPHSIEILGTSTSASRVKELQISFKLFACLCCIPSLTFQAFVSLLNIDQCQKLIVEAYSHTGGVCLAKVLLSSDGSIENHEPLGNLLWCICGKCRAMPLPRENVRC